MEKSIRSLLRPLNSTRIIGILMLNIERVKELINDPKLSDREIEEIRDGFYKLSEIIFEQWQAERIKAKKAETDNKLV